MLYDIVGVLFGRRRSSVDEGHSTQLARRNAMAVLLRTGLRSRISLNLVYEKVHDVREDVTIVLQ